MTNDRIRISKGTRAHELTRITRMGEIAFLLAFLEGVKFSMDTLPN